VPRLPGRHREVQAVVLAVFVRMPWTPGLHLVEARGLKAKVQADLRLRTVVIEPLIRLPASHVSGPVRHPGAGRRYVNVRPIAHHRTVNRTVHGVRPVHPISPAWPATPTKRIMSLRGRSQPTGRHQQSHNTTHHDPTTHARHCTPPESSRT
jgi:hypothetical protein